MSDHPYALSDAATRVRALEAERDELRRRLAERTAELGEAMGELRVLRPLRNTVVDAALDSLTHS